MDKYKSQTGFIYAPILRGFNEIGNIFELCCKTKKATGKNAYICGGYVRWCCSPRENPVEAGDVDIYCEDETVFNYLKVTFADKELEIRHENAMALTYKTNPEFPKTVQLIKPMREGAIVAEGNLETILDHFDFTVIRCGIFNESVALVDADYLHDEQENILRLKNIHCPISSCLRCMKYARKGYFLTPTECAKLFTDWTNRTPEYRQQVMGFLNEIAQGHIDVFPLNGVGNKVVGKLLEYETN